MIITEREIHHWANFNFPIYDNRSRHDFMHAENPALRRIENRRREKRSIHAAVCDGECGASEIFEFQFSFARSAGVIFGGMSLFGERLLIRALHYRSHAPPSCRSW